MRIYLLIIKGIALFENLLCYLALIFCSLLVVAQVANRYLFNFDIIWLGDLSLYIFIPFLIYSIAVSTRERQHTSVDVVLEMFAKNKPKVIEVWNILANLIVLMVLVYLIPMAYKVFLSAGRYPEYGTLVQWFNTSWIRQALLVSLLLSAFHTLHHIVMDIALLVKGSRPEVSK